MKVLKSWGADGQVILSLNAEDTRDLESQGPVFIEFDGLPVPFFIESCQPKGNRLVVKFEDVDTLDAAEEIVGRDVFFEEDEEEDEDSLIGLIIRDAASGKTIGPIVDYADYSGNICITVDYNGKEVILPLHEDLIRKVRKDSISLEIPQGLL